MKKFSDTYTNGATIGHHDGERIKYSDESITWNQMCCHHCGGTTLNFGHLSWGKLESTKKDTVSWGVGPQAYDILHTRKSTYNKRNEVEVNKKDVTLVNVLDTLWIRQV